MPCDVRSENRGQTVMRVISASPSDAKVSELFHCIDELAQIKLDIQRGPTAGAPEATFAALLAQVRRASTLTSAIAVRIDDTCTDRPSNEHGNDGPSPVIHASLRLPSAALQGAAALLVTSTSPSGMKTAYWTSGRALRPEGP